MNDVELNSLYVLSETENAISNDIDIDIPPPIKTVKQNKMMTAVKNKKINNAVNMKPQFKRRMNMGKR